MTKNPFASLFLICALGVSGLAKAAPTESQAISVFAAASLQNALSDIAKAYMAQTGVAVRLTFGGSPSIARQIEQGAPADIMISADADWMDYVQTRNLVDPASRTNLISNRLVLVAPVAAPVTLALAPPASAQKAMTRTLGTGRLAMADPDTVPAGRYGKAGLITLGLWDGVKGKIAPSDSVRNALAFVARGEAPLGLVYASDAVAEPKVKIVGVLPRTSHPLIVYPGAVVQASKVPDQAKAFLAWLKSRRAQAILLKAGFSPLP